MNTKSIYKDGTVNKTVLLGIASIGMMATSIYLLSHYFQVNYPDGLDKGSLCDLNSYFHCGASTASTN